MSDANSASVTGRELYHAAWKVVKEHFYDTERLKDWASWEHRFDEHIDSDEKAIAFIKEMVSSLNDSYTRVLEPVEVVEKQEQRESTESAVLVRKLGNIGYIRIFSFSQDNIVEQVAEAAAEIADCDAYIVDLRDNGGGGIDNTANCCELVVPVGCVATVESRLLDGRLKKRTVGLVDEAFITITNIEGEKEEVEGFMRRQAITKGKPVVVLINEYTASSAEIMAAAIVESDKESGLAVSMGTPTFGKGIAQGNVNVLDKLVIRISHMRFLSPTDVWFGDAQQTVCNNLKPMIAVEPTDADGANAQLGAAVEYLRKRLAA
jgi:Periplasmic protease